MIVRTDAFAILTLRLVAIPIQFPASPSVNLFRRVARQDGEAESDSDGDGCSFRNLGPMTLEFPD
jgi:hypothetical protein